MRTPRRSTSAWWADRQAWRSARRSAPPHHEHDESQTQGGTREKDAEEDRIDRASVERPSEQRDRSRRGIDADGDRLGAETGRQRVRERFAEVLNFDGDPVVLVVGSKAAHRAAFE